MTTNFSRRQFLGAAATTIVAAGFSSSVGSVAAADASAGGWTWQRLSKALITKTPTDEYCERLKKAGFDGIEVQNWGATVEEARQARLLAEKHGLRIHSVMRGWTNYNQADKLVDDMESVKTALRAAAAYGASAVLLVPCLVRGMAMPEAWDFDIDFDPKTLMVKSVVAGDNAPYADYIKAQNQATEASVRAVEALIPTAAKEGVMIALENVWNNLWCTPEFLAAFVKSFRNPWVKAYFDLGNHVKYARCEEWLKALGRSIVKLHIKGFAVEEVKGKRGGGPGKWTAVDDASIDWKNVRKTLEEIRYSGWITVEADSRTDGEHSKFLDEHFGA